MILDFDIYLKEGKVEQQHPDIERAHALMNKAERRLKYIRPLSEETSELVFEDVYDAIREASQSLMIIHGYKPISHEAIIAYLRDKENIDEFTVHTLDSYRKLRNRSVYEAQKISVVKAKETLDFAKGFIEKVRLKIKP